MRYTLYYILLIMAPLLTAIQCTEENQEPKDPEDKLPPITTTGENTFGCLVNGEAFRPGSTFLGGKSLSFNAEKKEISIRAFNESVKIYLEIQNLLDSTRKYNLKDSANLGLYVDKNNLNCQMYSYGSGGGKLDITRFDTTKKIISGTFNFQVWNNECDTVTITKGRFDGKY